MRSDSANQTFVRGARSRRANATAAAASQRPRARMPSSSGYMLASAATAAGLFFLLWFMLRSNNDEAPWVPAGLAASVVMLVAVAAREVVMRRAWARYILEHDRRETAGTGGTRTHSVTSSGGGGSRGFRPIVSYSSMLRALQKQSAEADAPGALPEAHLDAYLSCQEYLETADEALRGQGLESESRLKLRAGQERARVLARHHMLNWARAAARALTHEAQQRARLSDKIETGMRALDVIESARGIYPEEAELIESESAVRDFLASVKVSHWVELAERAAFKGYYKRAIDCYRDALFYLSRENVNEEARAETAERLNREIDLLRARLKTSKMTPDVEPDRPKKRPRRKDQ